MFGFSPETHMHFHIWQEWWKQLLGWLLDKVMKVLDESKNSKALL